MIPLSLDEGPKPKSNVHSMFLDQFDEFYQVGIPLKVVLRNVKSIKPKHISFSIIINNRCYWENKHLALNGLMKVPENVSLDYVETSFLGFSYEFWPHLYSTNPTKSNQNIYIEKFHETGVG